MICTLLVVAWDNTGSRLLRQGRQTYMHHFKSGLYPVVSISRGRILSGRNPFGHSVVVLRGYIVQSFAVVGAHFLYFCVLWDCVLLPPQQAEWKLFPTSGIRSDAYSVFQMVDIVGKPRVGVVVAGCGQGATTHQQGPRRQSPTLKNMKWCRTAANF